MGHTLYDGGTTSASGPTPSRLAVAPALFVAPSDVSRVGASADGQLVRVTSARGTIVLPVRADKRVAPGTAVVAAAPPGNVRPGDLLDVTALVTDVRVETVGRP
jgi:anaerobic selenocysteine-containing dehydrogenase